MQPDSIPPDFGHWFAGWVDGEGSFVIAKIPRDPAVAYWPKFALSLRADDSAVLEMARATTGVGRLYRIPRHGQPGNAKPMVQWAVYTKRDLMQLVRIFDRYPLRSKKARDYAIWREAVLYATRAGTSTGRRGQWAPMEEMRNRLMAVRLYENTDEDVDLLLTSPSMDQLTLLDGEAPLRNVAKGALWA